MNIKNFFLNCTNQLWGNIKLPPKEVFKNLYHNTLEQTSSDFYGQGQSIEDFENKFSKILGKEKAIFIPSGTMGQQIALRVWSDRLDKKTVAFHPLSHLEIHEQKAIYFLHPKLNVKPIGEKDRLICISDLETQNIQNAILLLELPQRELGGLLPSWEELVNLSNWCKAKNITLHLDGARIWECTPYYNKSVKEICELFDSVYVSFYKGLGSIAGAVIAGNKSFIEDCKIWQRRYGGNLISLYPYYLNADQSYEERISLMPKFHQRAIEIAKILSKFEYVSIFPKIPQTNMFHLHIQKDQQTVQMALIDIIKTNDIKILPVPRKYDNKTSIIEFSVGENTLNYSIDEIQNLFNEFFNILSK